MMFNSEFSIFFLQNGDIFKTQLFLQEIPIMTLENIISYLASADTLNTSQLVM